jgi:hypothetical protein
MLRLISLAILPTYSGNSAFFTLGSDISFSTVDVDWKMLSRILMSGSISK